MARRKRVMHHRRSSHRRRSNPVYRGRIKRGMYRYSSNPGRRYRRRRNPSYRRRHHYRRNPGFMSGTVGRVVGVIGGATVTKLLTDQLSNMVSMVSSGIPKYIAGLAVAFLQGKLIGKLAKNPGFGTDLQIGGYTYVALQVLNDFVPSLPLGLSGMGLITSQAGFGQPYVPIPGSMTSFVRPAGVPAPYVPPVTGGVRGLGRMSQRRIGRMA